MESTSRSGTPHPPSGSTPRKDGSDSLSESRKGEPRTPSLSIADYRHGPDRRTCRPDELQGRADEVEATVPRGGEILQYQILDDIDAAAGQEDQMPRHNAPELGISEPGHIPRHVVRPDRQYLSVREPVRGARSHARSREVAFFILPVAAVAGPDERHIAGPDVYALLLAAVLQILRRDGVAWLELIGALARGHVEEDSGGQYRRYLLDAESLEAARALDAAVHGDVAEERQGIRLMAKRVDVGPCVLSADDDAGGPRARPCFFGPVLIFVAAVQVVGVAGLPMGGGDGHAFRAGLLQVEDACADHHTGALSFHDKKSSGKARTRHYRGRGRAKLRRHEIGYGGGHEHHRELEVEHFDEETKESSPYCVLFPWVQLLLPASACRSNHAIPPSRASPGGDLTEYDTPVSFEYHPPLKRACRPATTQAIISTKVAEGEKRTVEQNLRSRRSE